MRTFPSSILIYFLMTSGNLHKIISHWHFLSQSSICQRDGWLNFTCTFVSNVYPMLYCLRVVLWGNWMDVSRCIVALEDPSSYTLIMALCWRIQKPLHSLTLLSPSSHGSAMQNPAIVPPRTVCIEHRPANSQAQTNAYCAPYTQCTDGCRVTAKHTWTYRKNSKMSILLHENIMMFFLNWIVFQFFPQFALQP